MTHGGDLLNNASFIDFLLFSAHFCTPNGASWDQPFNKPLALKYLFQDLLLEESKPKHLCLVTLTAE